MHNNRPKILLVEDEADACCALQSFLGRRGFTVTSTGSGLEALSLVEVSRPDLILLDITINDLNGIEVLKRVRQKDKDIKVIVITGQMCPASEIDSIAQLGIEGFFNKPLILSDLGELINRAFGSPLVTVDPMPAFSVPGTNADPKFHHKITNLLSNIRNKCENYLLDLQDGIYKNKTGEQKAQMAADVMEDVIRKVDEVSKIL
ncbi:MAG: response regulator [Candidatus Omnitrophica bacterium]|nr:response regulator [Candidatus Omnitrophota bacterium]